MQRRWRLWPLLAALGVAARASHPAWGQAAPDMAWALAEPGSAALGASSLAGLAEPWGLSLPAGPDSGWTWPAGVRSSARLAAGAGGGIAGGLSLEQWWQALQQAARTGTPLPAQDGVASFAVTWRAGPSAAQLRAYALLQGPAADRQALAGMELRWATAYPWRLGRWHGTWGSGLRLFSRLQAAQAGANPVQAAQQAGFGWDLGARLELSSSLQLACAAWELAGAAQQTPAGSATPSAYLWLGRPSQAACGLALDLAPLPVRTLAEWRSGNHWSVGLEQAAFGGAARIRAGYLRQDAGRRWATAGLRLGLAPLQLELAVAVPAHGEPLLASAGLQLEL
ncbi:MAG TPA: hypothetical protein VIL11_02860 [Limnochordales bacterium]